MSFRPNKFNQNPTRIPLTAEKAREMSAEGMVRKELRLIEQYIEHSTSEGHTSLQTKDRISDRAIALLTSRGFIIVRRENGNYRIIW